MIQSKIINIIVAIALSIALIIGVTFMKIGAIQNDVEKSAQTPEYAAEIFGNDIISIEIIADEDDWQNMLDNAIDEQFIMANVIVNGTEFQQVGIRPKGNSSLNQVASSNSDRYSFRLQFDEYIKGQTCLGLESFVVNNIHADNTYMKEYVSYELMKEIGVDTPYFGYTDIKVNGENWGLYLAVELYNDSYEQRVFGETSGNLYNVKSMDIGGVKPMMEDGKHPIIPDGQNRFPEIADGQNIIPQIPDDAISGTNSPPSLLDPSISDQKIGEDMKTGGSFGRGIGGRGSLGGSLEYVDDNTYNYSAIFSNVVGKATEIDFQRIVKALKALSEGNELETYFDVDQILRYLAAHTIVVNLDSYSSRMAQNYYIYENDGKITILPWDYNLAWGSFQNEGVSSVINFPIDTPLSGIDISSRPLIEKLFENSDYLERYHNYLQNLVDIYFSEGKFEKKINELDALISDYVKNDATAFCTYEEYNTAVSTFITLGNLRAQSVQGQLDGTIPSTTAEQDANPDQLIPAGDLKLSDMGSMMGGKDGNNLGFPSNIASQDLNPFLEDRNSGPDQNRNDLILIGVLVVALGAALFFVVRFKKSY